MMYNGTASQLGTVVMLFMLFVVLAHAVLYATHTRVWWYYNHRGASLQGDSAATTHCIVRSTDAGLQCTVYALQRAPVY